MSDTPITDFLNEYVKKETSRFFMPGHKGTKIKSNPLRNVMPLDLTEIPGADSLFHSNGIIAQSEKNIAEIYKAKKTLFSTGGATLCIQTMLSLVAKKNGVVAIGRSMHVSAVNAMALLGLEALYLSPDNSAGQGFCGRITPQEVEQALSSSSEICAVYITSPDYFGVMSDIRGISEVCKRHKVPLIVDNAHGAHLIFERPSLHPIAQGADMCCDSAHKTLPALTGGAFLHINNDRYIDTAKIKMAEFGSTSPSYLIMASLDLCAPFLKNEAQEGFRYVFNALDNIKETAKESGIKMPLGQCDRARLVIDAYSIGLSGNELSAHLMSYNIEAEYASKNAVVLMASPFNRRNDFSKLETAISRAGFKGRAPLLYDSPPFVIPKKAMPLRDAFLSDWEDVSVDMAEGRICAKVECPCPPGIPVVMAGELCDKNVINSLINYGITHIKVVK